MSLLLRLKISNGNDSRGKVGQLLMKSAMWRNTYIEIKTTFSRFIAIFVIVMLGVGFFAGLKATAPVMKNTADNYFDEQNLMDIRLLSTVGFTEEDVAAIKNESGIRDVMATYSLDVLIESESGLKAARIQALPNDMKGDQQMNKPVLVEGRLPEKSGECVLDKKQAGGNPDVIGSTIVISDQNTKETLDMLNTHEYTITGIVESPYYISIERGTTNIGNGRISSFLMIPQGDFKSDYYLELFATVEGARELSSYSDKYTNLIDDTIKRLETLANDRETIRYNNIVKNALRYAQEEIDDARTEINKIERPAWYVLGRDTNPGFAGFGADADRIDAITTVFPIFFFLVAALVCLTTMARMVEEQRTQIGILKALGYSKGAIASKYLIYTGTATILGSAVGLAVGFLTFPSVIYQAYSIMYTLPSAILSFNVKYALISSLTAILSTMLATLWACYHELVSVPAELIRPKAPSPGRRVFLEKIPFLWKRLSFTMKVTARNLFRYKKRFFMTIIGIGGCTTLLLTGFGLRDSIMGIVSRQFGDIHTYDMIVGLSDASDSTQKTQLNDGLTTFSKEALYAMLTSVDIAAQGEKMTAYLFVPENAEKLNNFVSFRKRVSNERVPFPQPGKVVLSEKMAIKLDIVIGDEITIKKGEFDKVNAIVGGITENYVYNYIYMSPQDYTAAFGRTPEYKQVVVNLPYADQVTEEGEQSISEEILKFDNVSSVTFTAKSRREFSDTMKSLNSVVILIIICASLLAFVVLYNLTNINITERIREIATIKVLGFFDQEVSAYVYRENIILTLIGTILGLIGGIFLHQFVVQTAEVDMVMFERSIKPLSYVWSTVFTFVFAGLVNFTMYFRLRKVSMVESLKSTE